MTVEEIKTKFADQLLDGQLPLKAVEGAVEARKGRSRVTEAVQLVADTTPGAFAYIEFGTWLGASALEAAAACDRCVVFCVDTWLGSREHWVTEGGAWGRPQLALKGGIPHLWDRFKANVEQYKEADRIIPMMMTTQCATELLTCHRFWWLPLKVVFVDAAHDQRSVEHDIIAAKTMLEQREGGILVGHDWPWEPVRNAYFSVFPGDLVDQDGVYFSKVIPRNR